MAETTTSWRDTEAMQGPREQKTRFKVIEPAHLVREVVSDDAMAEGELNPESGCGALGGSRHAAATIRGVAD